MALLGPQTGAAKKAVFIATRKTKLNYHHNKKDQQKKITEFNQSANQMNIRPFSPFFLSLLYVIQTSSKTFRAEGIEGKEN